MKITLDDLYLDEDPPRIELLETYTKNGSSRDVYISDEAQEAIKDWLLIREGYIRTAVKRSTRNKKKREDNRVFPFSANIARILWNSALDKTQLNEKDRRAGRHIYRLHTLRKFFRTYHRGNRDVVEYLMGHAGYLAEEYVRLDDRPEFVKKEYKDGVHGVTIFGPSANILEELNTQRKMMMQMREYIDKIVQDLLPNMVGYEDLKELSTTYRQLFE